MFPSVEESSCRTERKEEEKSQTYSTLILWVPHRSLLGQQGNVWVGEVSAVSLGSRRLEARLEAAGSTPGSEEGQWSLGTEWPLTGDSDPAGRGRPQLGPSTTVLVGLGKMA